MQVAVTPPDAYFHQVVALQETSEAPWEQLLLQAPLLPRGWYELSRFPQEDRVEFTRAFWQTQIGTHTESTAQDQRLTAFLDQIEAVDIMLTQGKPDHLFEGHMLYTLREGRGFLYGAPPASSEALAHLLQQFAHLRLPPAYLAFLRMHDGFSRYMDGGLLKTKEMARAFQSVQQQLAYTVLDSPDGRERDTLHTVPFYESILVGTYQCFDAVLESERESGNYTLSLTEGFHAKAVISCPITKIFPNFLDWLCYYVEDREKMFTNR